MTEKPIIESIDDILPIFCLSNGELKPENKVKNFSDPTINQTYSEGGIREITVELHQRNASLRNKALEHYGYICYVCGEKFEETYGPDSEECFEVHHLTPLSTQEKVCENTLNDVRVVCANCHRILHKNGALGINIDQLREFVHTTKTNSK